MSESKPTHIEAWRSEANCREIINPKTGEPLSARERVELFYPENNHDRPHPLAIVACRGCSVRDECLEWGLYHEGYGYMGGTTQSERNRLRTKRRIYLRAEGGGVGGKVRSYAGRRDPHPCGTIGGYRQHIRLLQHVQPQHKGGCGCYEAWANELERRRMRRNENKQAVRKQQKADNAG